MSRRLIILGGLLLAGCGLPPPVTTPGYAALQPGRRGQMDCELRGSWYLLANAEGSGHLEPYLSERLSVPITFGGGSVGGLKARVGARYRLKEVLTLGGGLGTTLLYLGAYSLGGPYERYGAATMDGELMVGWRRGWFFGGLAVRPSVSVFGHEAQTYPGVHGHLGLDLVLAFYVRRNLAITWHVELGVGSDPTGLEPGYPVIITLGSSLGLAFHVGLGSRKRER